MVEADAVPMDAIQRVSVIWQDLDQCSRYSMTHLAMQLLVHSEIPFGVDI